MEAKKTCAERIQEGLRMRGMKQVDLSQKTGIPTSTINQYVRGKYIPKQNPTYLIAKALDVNEAWLMGFDVEPKRKLFGDERVMEATDKYKTLMDTMKNNGIDLLIDKAKDLTEEEIKQIVEIVEIFKRGRND